MDAYTLIIQHFNFTEDNWEYEFRYQILDEFLCLPGALEALRTGFEQLFGSDSDFTKQEGIEPRYV